MIELKELIVELLELRSVPQYNVSVRLLRDFDEDDVVYDVYLVREGNDYTVKFCLAGEILYVTTYMRAKAEDGFKREKRLEQVPISLADPNLKALLRAKARIIF